MLKRRVIPCLLLNHRKLVKTRQFKHPQYVGDPINTVRIFNDKEVDEIVVLDISVSREKKEPDFEYIEQLASECFMPFSYGGGVRTFEHAKRLFELGVEKIVFNHPLFEDPGLVKKVVETFGAQSVVASLDITRNWLGKLCLYHYYADAPGKKDLSAYLHIVEELGVGELLVTAVHKEGTFEGYDAALLEEVAGQVSIPLVINGGAGSLDDFKKALDSGADAVAAGSFFVFHGKHRAVLVTYPTDFANGVVQ